MFEIDKFIADFFLYGTLIKKDEWVAVYEAMAVHTRKKKPENLLLKRRPNEEKHIHEYRLDNYEAITYGSMNKAFDSLFRLLSGINYNLKISDNLREYINKRIFKQYTFEGYLANVVLKRCIEDPNGFLVWYPTNVGDTSKKITVKPKLVYSKDVHYLSDGVFSFLSDEKSKVSVGRKEELSGDVYWIFTENEFYRYYQTGKKSGNDYLLELVYEHKIGMLPVIVLGGDMNADEYYDSFFAPYVAFGNEAIRQFSDWQAIMTTSSFPYIEDFVVECEYRPDKNRESVIIDHDLTEEKYPGNNELGELKAHPKTPYNVTWRKVASGTDMEGILPADIPSRRFISPDINIAKYSGEAWKSLLMDAEDALHLNLGQSNQSGTAKELDKEAHYSMITKIGNNYFDNIMLNSLLIINGYLFVREDEKGDVVINKPSTFKVKTEGDLIDEIGVLTEKKVPALFLCAATKDLAMKYFSGDPVQKKMFDIIALADPLYVYSTEQRTQMAIANLINRADASKSVYMYTVLLNVVKEMSEDTFMSADSKIIIDKLNVLMEDYIPEEPTPLIDNEEEEKEDEE